MDAEYQWKDVWDKLKIFSKWVVSIGIDNGFLAGWAFLQWLIHAYVIKPFELQGVDEWILVVLQVVFGFSTLVLVALYIYLDLAKMFLQVRRRVREEADKDRRHD